MADLRDQLGSLSTSTNLPDGLPSDVSVSASGAKLVNRQRGVLEIHTKEGDVVTLSFKSRTSVAVDGQQADDGVNSLSGTNAELRSDGQVSVSVKGDLNTNEQNAIADLVGKVGDLTQSFFNGSANDVLSQAASLTYDSSQLTGYSLDLSLKQSISAYAYVQQPTAASAASSIVPVVSTPIVVPPAASPVSTATVTNADVEPAAVAVPTDSTSSVTNSDSTTAADGPVPGAVNTPVAATQDSSSTGTQIIADYVAKVRTAFKMTSAGDASLGISYQTKVHLLMSSIAQSMPASETSNDSAMGALQQQLSAAA